MDDSESKAGRSISEYLEWGRELKNSAAAQRLRTGGTQEYTTRTRISLGGPDTTSYSQHHQLSPEYR
jgi:hypothetical protein